MDKQSIRKQMKQARLDLSSKDYQDKSNLIITALKKHVFYKSANTIGIYVSCKQEVDTIHCIQDMLKDKRVCIPKIANKQMEFYHITSLAHLKKNHFGILEPVNQPLVPKESIDLLIVPMLAFDHYGQRIGYGGGYYDRYLENYHGNTIGLAFSFQEVECVETSKYDMALDVILDENS